MKNAASTKEVAKMDKTLKAKWVKALLSGEIKQARGTLLNENGAMCCIGVLEHVAGTPTKEISRMRHSICPVSDLKGVGMSTRRHLANMNDGEEMRARTFKEIAAYIKRNI